MTDIKLPDSCKRAAITMQPESAVTSPAGGMAAHQEAGWRVSCVLPVRNEMEFIEEVLSAVVGQEYPSELLEVIVADGMSDDGTREIVQRFARKDARVRLLDNPKRIAPAGLNIGIGAARGDVIVRVDGHAVLPPGYVRECIQWLSEADVECVGGAINSVGRGQMGEAIAVAMSSAFGVGNSKFRTSAVSAEPIQTDTVPFGAYRRQVFDRIGLFRENMLCHEDYEFSYRLRKAGGKVLLLPWLRAKYYVRSSLRALCRQYWQYGIWKGRFLRSHPESVECRHCVPPLFLAVLLIGLLASTVTVVAAIGSGLLAAAYLIFLFAATGWLALRRKWHLLFVLPAIFVIIHFAWGVGVWVGLVRGPVPGKPPAL